MASQVKTPLPLSTRYYIKRPKPRNRLRKTNRCQFERHAHGREFASKRYATPPVIARAHPTGRGSVSGLFFNSSEPENSGFPRALAWGWFEINVRHAVESRSYGFFSNSERFSASTGSTAGSSGAFLPFECISGETAKIPASRMMSFASSLFRSKVPAPD